jgi:hypothetical protein
MRHYKESSVSQEDGRRLGARIDQKRKGTSCCIYVFLEDRDLNTTWAILVLRKFYRGP